MFNDLDQFLNTQPPQQPQEDDLFMLFGKHTPKDYWQQQHVDSVERYTLDVIRTGFDFEDAGTASLDHQGPDNVGHVFDASTEHSSYSYQEFLLDFQPDNPMDLRPPAQVTADVRSLPSMKEFFCKFYTKNELWDHHLEHPVLKQFVPLLVGQELLLTPHSSPGPHLLHDTNSLKFPARLLKEKRPSQLTNKVHSCVLTLVSEGSEAQNAQMFHMARADVAFVFQRGDIKTETRQIVLNSPDLFDTIFTQPFFTTLLASLNAETQRDIDTNLLAKLDPLLQSGPGAVSQFINEISTADGTSTARHFKKPFTYQENIAAVVMYLKEFLYEIKLAEGNKTNSDKSVLAKLTGNRKTQFSTLLEIRNHFQSMLIENKLLATQESYPSTKQRKIASHKDVHFQSFVWVKK